MNSRADFIAQLVALGYAPTAATGNFVVFPFTIPVGKFAGTQITLGFEVHGDVALNPPPGPHVSPRLLPQNTASTVHPAGGIHESPLGSDWQYWSRPCNGWAASDRNARAYLAHIHTLFDTQ